MLCEIDIPQSAGAESVPLTYLPRELWNLVFSSLPWLVYTSTVSTEWRQLVFGSLRKLDDSGGDCLTDNVLLLCTALEELNFYEFNRLWKVHGMERLTRLTSLNLYGYCYEFGDEAIAK